MSGVKVTMTITVDGTASPSQTFDNLTGAEARHLGQHLIAHALSKVMDMAPDNPQAAGSRVVEFDYVYDANGIVATSAFKWEGLDDAMVGALQGALDGAIGKLDKHIIAKKR